ncbi:MAG: hypothetical protein BHV96_02465 [Clostridium sp. CAG:354_28_25]|jgi:hypothetical protein|uniref:hypothetical protein n=1 Tax=Candidatus Merdicola sp. TaxID=3085652 RepID=UPI00096381E8|nr:MAG: hypothetical protein BHV96_02465 [Clostridium sp. CAG:354_28_25]
MKKIRIAYSKLAFGVRYALAYVWTVIMVMGIAFGVKLDNTYFWLVPGSIILGLFILKDKIDRVLSILLILNTGFFILEILTENVDKWSVITMELMIIIIGPLFFKEHAK